MKIWLQVITAFGILCVCAAALSYTWTVRQNHLFEERVREFCADRYHRTRDDVKTEYCVKAFLRGSQAD